MTEEQLQWLIVKLRIALADLLNPADVALARAAAEKLIDEDASESRNYTFDYERLRRWGDIPSDGGVNDGNR